MKIEIIPQFEYLREYIESLPQRFESEGRTIHAGRNIVKVLSVNGMEINIKRYHVPSFINKFIYSFIRPPKGWRAYTYAQQLLEKGFETPQPIAYIEEHSCGLIGYSYFVSVQSPYTHRFYEFGDCPIEKCEKVVTSFAHYVAALHESGVLHCDFSPGNILFDNINGEYRFSLVDINRMRFCKVDIKKGCANFARLWGQKAFFILLAKEYAQARGLNETACIELILSYRKKFWQRYTKKHKAEFHLEF